MSDALLYVAAILLASSSPPYFVAVATLWLLGLVPAAASTVAFLELGLRVSAGPSP